MNHVIRVVTVSLSLILATSASATEVTLNGFANFTAGRLLSGVDRQVYEFRCPCAVGNYEYAGVYEKKDWAVAPESAIGMQANITIDPKLSATVQLVGHGPEGFRPRTDWAFASYELDPKWTIQVGHKRLPIYYYSDFMYVGYAYPWVRPPQDLYGWQIYDYNGINLLFKDTWGNWAATGNIWMGESRDRDNTMLSKLYYGNRIDESWKNIVGGYLDINNDIVGLRAVVMRNGVDRFEYQSTGVVTKEDNTKQEFIGLALNVDYGNFLLRSESNYFNRPSRRNNYFSYLLGGGYRLGNVTGMLTYSSFKERAAYWEEVEIHKTKSASLRWDFHKSAALKLQFDKFDDKSKWDFVGDSRLVTVSVNLVF